MFRPVRVLFRNIYFIMAAAKFLQLLVQFLVFLEDVDETIKEEENEEPN